IKTDVRIIAATNRDLEAEIEKGNFREDLYYRINIFQIKLPSLRERVADIELLVKFFLKSFSLKTGKNINSVSTDYLKALKNHPWKGNIRELRNVIERSVILTDASELGIESLPVDISVYSSEDYSQTKMLSAFSMASAEKMQIQKVLNHTKGNKAEAARLLEIGIATLYRKIEEYKIF
ncbi:helix-turn-helix domain-containing protein, partial [Chryseobacterium sp. 2TAF14]|uniref:helix-turn-helix domain-containing protein n=1 Tax=Chryseobacterium sp. 2TAF14 TaxID=3233007 RepID=UPI003F8FA11D